MKMWKKLKQTNKQTNKTKQKTKNKTKQTNKKQTNKQTKTKDNRVCFFVWCKPLLVLSQENVDRIVLLSSLDINPSHPHTDYIDTNIALVSVKGWQLHAFSP